MADSAYNVGSRASAPAVENLRQPGDRLGDVAVPPLPPKSCTAGIRAESLVPPTLERPAALLTDARGSRTFGFWRAIGRQAVHYHPNKARGPGASGGAEQLSVGGTVVGMFPEMVYEEATVELCPGDVLLAFTDGVPEAHNPESEEFGEERLQLLLRQTAHLPANEISARLSDEMKDWIRDAEQYDDLTFIVMKVR